MGEVINSAPAVRGLIKLVFHPDFNVTLAQNIYPAAELAEQISTAGKEASGTGSMKFTMNGALNIGTLDGANIEIREEVGAENFFLFGLSAEQVARLRQDGYQPQDHYRGDTGLFRPPTEQLLHRDDYMRLADYRAYADCQAEVDRAFRDRAHWTRMSILNVARSGKFSSDRAVREYAEKLWHLSPRHGDSQPASDGADASI